MALRRTLTLRSLFSARSYQPSCCSIILRDNDKEEKPNYGSLLHQRSFSSSILSHHLRSSTHLSLCTPFGVSICRSMSTSHVPGLDEENGDVDLVAGTAIDSVLEDVDHVSGTAIDTVLEDVDHVVSGTAIDTVLEDVASQTVINVSDAVHFDVVQQIIHNVHSFTGLNWWATIVLTTLLIRGVTIPLMIYNELERRYTPQFYINRHFDRLTMSIDNFSYEFDILTMSIDNFSYEFDILTMSIDTSYPKYILDFP